jgi:hypothetical protein
MQRSQSVARQASVANAACASSWSGSSSNARAASRAASCAVGFGDLSGAQFLHQRARQQAMRARILGRSGNQCTQARDQLLVFGCVRKFEQTVAHLQIIAETAAVVFAGAVGQTQFQRQRGGDRLGDLALDREHVARLRS